MSKTKYVGIGLPKFTERKLIGATIRGRFESRADVANWISSFRQSYARGAGVSAPKSFTALEFAQAWLALQSGYWRQPCFEGSAYVFAHMIPSTVASAIHRELNDGKTKKYRRGRDFARMLRGNYVGRPWAIRTDLTKIIKVLQKAATRV